MPCKTLRYTIASSPQRHDYSQVPTISFRERQDQSQAGTLCLYTQIFITIPFKAKYKQV